MKIQRVIVQCEEGLHLRIASQVAKIAQKSGGSIHIRSKKSFLRVNACSVLELLTLGATMGTPLEIVANCPDEDAVLGKLADVFEQEAGG